MLRLRFRTQDRRVVPVSQVRSTADKPLLRTPVLGLAPSWRCAAACTHCFLPRELRRAEAPGDFGFAEAALRDLPDGIRAIAFTGGEPFHWPDRLLGLLALAAEAGRPSTVVTGASWARDLGKARELLVACYERGLRGLSISIDRYHVPVLPEDRIAAVVEFARGLGMAVNLRGVGGQAQARMDVIRARGGGTDDETLINLHPTGEGSKLPEDAAKPEDLEHAPCALLPLVRPDGKITACCGPRVLEIHGPPLLLGDLSEEPLGTILERASRDLLLATLVVKGPAGLARLLGREAHSTTCGSRCGPCLDVLADPATVALLYARVEQDVALQREVWAQLALGQAAGAQELLPELSAPIPEPTPGRLRRG